MIAVRWSAPRNHVSAEDPSPLRKTEPKIRVRRRRSVSGAEDPSRRPLSELASPFRVSGVDSTPRRHSTQRRCSYSAASFLFSGVVPTHQRRSDSAALVCFGGVVPIRHRRSESASNMYGKVLCSVLGVYQTLSRNISVFRLFRPHHLITGTAVQPQLPSFVGLSPWSSRSAP